MPSFFDEVDASGIVEEHIQQVRALEHDKSEAILESYGGVRDRLIQRLSTLPRGSFSAQHLRGTLAQVQGAIEAINKNLHGSMIAQASESAMLGVEDLVQELNVFDEKFTGAVTPINLNAALVAQDTANFLVTKYQTNLDAYGNNLLAQIANGLFSASIGEANTDEVVGRIGRFFSAEEWKLRRVVRTELHNIYNVGKINGMKALSQGDIPDLKKTLYHPIDSRTGKDSLYAATLHMVIPIDESFRYEWRGQVREFIAPPDRPNDRSVLIPAREEWLTSADETEL